MTEADEDDDYMSDKFLSSASDVRPSLIHSNVKKRQLQVEKKRAEDCKKQRQEKFERTGVQSNERLQESLKRPIEASNKGFQLLSKMGYTPGQALGKSTSVQNARTEPIGIRIKNDRGGLGREQALQELAEKRRQLREQHLQRKYGGGEVMTSDEYRRRATEKAKERFVHGALKNCQLSCKSLDTKAGIETPELMWFWPEQLEKESEEQNTVEETPPDEVDALEEDFTNAEKLEMLTNYLRSSYQFCFWCGVEYKDQQDLDENCPGLTRDEH